MEGWTKAVRSGDATGIQTKIHTDDRCPSRVNATGNETDRKYHRGYSFIGNPIRIKIRSRCDAD